MSTKRGTEKRAAFVRGFLNGMAAPAFLYSTKELPAIPKLEPVSAPTTPLGTALAGDWHKIGADIVTVIDRHVKTSAEK